VPAVDVSPRLVAAAVGGDQRALEQLLRVVVDDGRRIAQRMMWHPQDAEDATQEILVKVATRLRTFRGDARLTTWVHLDDELLAQEVMVGCAQGMLLPRSRAPNGLRPGRGPRVLQR
jgi:hypothetical protein